MGVCPPAVASLVKAGAAAGWSKSIWATVACAVTAIGLYPTVTWLLPALQTRQSADFTSLQGTWQQVSNEQGGKLVDPPAPVTFVSTLTIDGRGYHRVQTLSDGRVIESGQGSFVLDSEQHPKAIDFTQREGTIHGIYELKGEALTICVAKAEGPRPEDLATRANDDRILSHYKRVR
jgi:uncharacterized protein (TIGR03067 family)